MTSNLIALTMVTLSVLWGPTLASAESSRTARGTIAAIGGQSLTVKVGDQDLKFSVDSKTTVLARGASTKSARAAAAGRSGVHIDEVLQAGQPVAVTYRDTGSALLATEIKAIPKSAAVATSDKAEMRSAGVVKSMGADWITINGRSGGGASFEQTFKIDHGTKVFAKGASRAVSPKDGKAPFSTLVTAGDYVSVSYHKTGNALLASDVHVTTKASH